MQHAASLSFICDNGHPLPVAIYPPTQTGSPQTSVYLILQPIRCTAGYVAITAGELLPHLFTLIPASRNGHFLLHYSALTNCFQLGNMVPFVARTFLPINKATNRSAILQRYYLFYFIICSS